MLAFLQLIVMGVGTSLTFYLLGILRVGSKDLFAPLFKRWLQVLRLVVIWWGGGAFVCNSILETCMDRSRIIMNSDQVNKKLSSYTSLNSAGSSL